VAPLTADKIGGMAKQKSSKTPPSRGRPPKGTDVLVTVSANVDPRMVPILDEESDTDKRSRSQIIALLLEEALTAKGKWPPP
jgi:hypothetical protein